ncbi:MAG: DUF2225 domain-containing protein [Calditrichia bacterium]
MLKNNITTSNNDLPYSVREIACPVCGKSSPHYYLKDRTYSVDRREEDRFISRYHWVKPEYESCNLYYFYFWHCPHCRFTDERNVFLERPERRKTELNRFLEQYGKMSSEDAFIQQISNTIGYPEQDYFSVLRLHLLATYIQQTGLPARENLHKTARYYLRTAWIFRLRSGMASGNSDSGPVVTYLNHVEHFQSNYVNLLASFEEMHEWLGRNMPSGGKEQLSGSSPKREDIDGVYQKVSNQLNQIMSLLPRYREFGMIFQQMKSQAEKGEASIEHLTTELVSLKTIWSEIPLSETDALQKAAEFYRKCLRSKLFDHDQTLLFQIYRLIAYLYFRLEQYEDAGNLLEQLAGKATRIRNGAYRRIQQKKEDIDKAKQLYKLATDTLEYIGLQKRHIREKIMEADYKTGQEIFTRMRESGVDELREELNKANLCDEVVEQFVIEKMKENKKGIFQIFKF